MRHLRAMCAAMVALSLVCAPVWGATTPNVVPLGTVIAAERAHVGEASASVGTTIYAGDRLSTEMQGSVQVRAGSARLLLLSSSAVIVNDNEGAPSARLLLGTATFSTGNAHAFTLYASKAVVQPQANVPTVGQVIFLNDKELLVTARRGGLTVSVEGETQIIPEGASYRVLLDPEPEAAQGSGGEGTDNDRHKTKEPRRAGRSRFLFVVVGVTALATGFAVYKACESPDRP